MAHQCSLQPGATGSHSSSAFLFHSSGACALKSAAQLGPKLFSVVDRVSPGGDFQSL